MGFGDLRRKIYADPNAPVYYFEAVQAVLKNMAPVLQKQSGMVANESQSAYLKIVKLSPTHPYYSSILLNALLLLLDILLSAYPPCF